MDVSVFSPWCQTQQHPTKHKNYIEFTALLFDQFCNFIIFSLQRRRWGFVIAPVTRSNQKVIDSMSGQAETMGNKLQRQRLKSNEPKVVKASVLLNLSVCVYSRKCSPFRAVSVSSDAETHAGSLCVRARGCTLFLQTIPSERDKLKAVESSAVSWRLCISSCKQMEVASCLVCRDFKVVCQVYIFFLFAFLIENDCTEASNLQTVCLSIHKKKVKGETKGSLTRTRTDLLSDSEVIFPERSNLEHQWLQALNSVNQC